MHQLRIYKTLGVTRNTRRLRMRDNILWNAEKLHAGGIDSRIPFLKTITGSKDASQGSTARRDSSTSILELREGDVVDLNESSLDQIIRFNAQPKGGYTVSTTDPP